MNPTKLIPGDRSLPIPAGDSAPEAHQRAPTLMAGDGSHGEVRVWSPDVTALRRCAWGWRAGFAAYIACPNGFVLSGSRRRIPPSRESLEEKMEEAVEALERDARHGK